MTPEQRRAYQREWYNKNIKSDKGYSYVSEIEERKISTLIQRGWSIRRIQSETGRSVTTINKIRSQM